MSKLVKLDRVLEQLDAIHLQLKQIGVAPSTLTALNQVCEAIELDIREVAVDNSALDEDEICDMFDANPNLTLVELATISGRTVDELKKILMK